MTPLVADPADHWVDLDQRPIRRPLLMEMMSAYDRALDAPADPPHRRAIWTGVGCGYAVAFGFVTREALDRARRTPGALTVHPDSYKPSAFHDADTAWASGVLWGYLQGTAERDDITSCTHCGQRLIVDLDWIADCHHGDFCEDCIGDWHRNTTPAGPADVCTYEDNLGDAA